MIIKDTELVDIHTSTGPMRTYLFRPLTEGRYPGLLLFSEIFQMTGLIREEKWDRLLCCEPYEAEAAFLPTHMATPYADFVRRVGFPMMRAGGQEKVSRTIVHQLLAIQNRGRT